jgi:hypothetical protein
MKTDKIWMATLNLLLICLITYRLAVFSDDGSGNSFLYQLFWIACTGMFFTSSLLLAKLLKLQNLCKYSLVAFLTFLGCFSSSLLGLMSIFGLTVLIPYFVFVGVLLIVVIVKSIFEIKNNP